MEVSDNEILREIKEEWKRRIEEKKFKTIAKTNRGEKSLISNGLKVRSKGSGTVYTVHSVSSDKVVLREPSGSKRLVSRRELEADYELE